MYSMINTHLFDPGFDDTEVVFIKSIKGSILASLLFFLFFIRKEVWLDEVWVWYKYEMDKYWW